jgi:hypothetical protein
MILVWFGLIATPSMLVPVVWSQGVYDLRYKDITDHKKFYDDPRPIYKDLPLKDVMPPEVYNKLIFDQEAMKSLWAEVVGFKAPDEVGKIAPEIKPGTYTLADKEMLPFKELMAPRDYERWKSPGPPLMGTVTEITVVPTRQYYYALPIAEATKKHMGESQQTDKGYLKYDTYTAGFPFPRPSGEFAAQQVVYNWEKRYVNGETFYLLLRVMGHQKELKRDFDSLMEMYYINKLEGRVMMEPLGWFDERARKNKEMRQTLNRAYSPRDLYGNVFCTLSYSDYTKPDQPLIYLNMMRRVRKMSGTDTQDPMGGQDIIYDDGDGFNQKQSPDRYPYKYEILEDREFLMAAYTLDGSGYLSSEGLELKDFEFERRPCYLIKMTQLDNHYIYSYRLLWVDKETFLLLRIQNYDQKGRLYRDMFFRYFFHPEMGMPMIADTIARDNIDYHSLMQQFYIVPAPHITRKELSMRSIIKAK